MARSVLWVITGTGLRGYATSGCVFVSSQLGRCAVKLLCQVLLNELSLNQVIFARRLSVFFCSVCCFLKGLSDEENFSVVLSGFKAKS